MKQLLAQASHACTPEGADAGRPLRAVVSEEAILRGHFDATRHRFAASEGPILVLHDTTEFSWWRERPEAVGSTMTTNSGRDKAGRYRLHTVCGLLMHSSLTVTTDGLRLGMNDITLGATLQTEIVGN